MKFLIFCLLMMSPSPLFAADFIINFAPISEGDSTVNGYKVHYDTDQSGVPYEGKNVFDQGDSPIDVSFDDIDQNKPTITLTGADTCQKLWVALTAYNSGGESDFSAEIFRYILAPPKDIVFSNRTDTSFDISWTENIKPDDGGAVLKYYVHVGTESDFLEKGAYSTIEIKDGLSASIADLPPNQTYFVSVESTCTETIDNENKKRRFSPIKSVILGADSENTNNANTNNANPTSDQQMGGAQTTGEEDEEAPILVSGETCSSNPYLRPSHLLIFLVYLAFVFARKRRIKRAS